MPKSHETPNHPTHRKPRKTHGQTSKNKPIHNSTCLPLITGPTEENFDPDEPDNIQKEHKHRSDAHRRGRTNDNRTMIAIGRIGADMRSAKDGIVLEGPSLSTRRIQEVLSREGSRSRSARSPQAAKKAVQQREPDLHHHRTLTETTTRTQEPIGHQDPHISNRDAHTTANIMCMTHDRQINDKWRSMPTSHETPNHPTQRKTAEHLWPDIKNHHHIQNICLSSQDLNRELRYILASNKQKRTQAPFRRTSSWSEAMTAKR